MKELSIFVLLTILLSFTIPVVLLTVGLAIVCLAASLPGLAALGRQSYGHLVTFLATFGSGCPFAGIITIGSTSALAGGLFGLAVLQRPLNAIGNRSSEPLLADKARQN